MTNLVRLLFVLQLLVFQATAAEAYIGPGTAVGAIVTMLGVVGSFFLAIFAVLWYPIKRLLKRRKQSRSNGGQSPLK